MLPNDALIRKFIRALNRPDNQIEIKMIIGKLKARGIDINLSAKKGDALYGEPIDPVLHLALKPPTRFDDGYDVVRLLLKQGADVNARSHEGDTPLMTAIRYDYPLDVIQCLVAHGADIYAVTQSSQNKSSQNQNVTPLFHLACFSHEDVIRYLIACYRKDNVDIEALAHKKTGRNTTAYNTLINLEKIGVLFAIVPDILTREDENGDTVLMHYCRQPWVSENALFEFIQRGADLCQPNSRGIRPIDILNDHIKNNNNNLLVEESENPEFQKKLFPLIQSLNEKMALMQIALPKQSRQNQDKQNNLNSPRLSI